MEAQRRIVDDRSGTNRTRTIVLTDLQRSGVDGRATAVVVYAEVAENEFAIAAFVDAADSTNCTEADECIIAVRIDVNRIRQNICIDAIKFKLWLVPVLKVLKRN